MTKNWIFASSRKIKDLTKILEKFKTILIAVKYWK
jgi:hypothetical protein